MKVSCPNCGGTGWASAMSGAHVPYTIACSDCNNSGAVSEEKATQIRQRHLAWDARQSDQHRKQKEN
jgi:DnaJ-class molecular chaperone